MMLRMSLFAPAAVPSTPRTYSKSASVAISTTLNGENTAGVSPLAALGIICLAPVLTCSSKVSFARLRVMSGRKLLAVYSK